jgi:hypothetical protein
VATRLRLQRGRRRLSLTQTQRRSAHARLFDNLVRSATPCYAISCCALCVVQRLVHARLFDSLVSIVNSFCVSQELCC